MNSGMSTLISGAAPRAVDNRLIRLFGLGYLRATRDALIHERLGYLVSILASFGRHGMRVLDVGCGSGMALYYLDRFCGGVVDEYVGIDMNIERLRERWRFVNLPHAFQPVDLDEEWNFGTFDLVWCSEVIEHLLDDEHLFRRLITQLGPSGVLVITTPSRSFVEKMGRLIPGFDRVSPTQDGSHVRTGYDLENFRRMASLSGLLLVSHAWISPCTARELRVRNRPTALGQVQRSLCDIGRRKTRCVIDGDQSRYANQHYTMAVSFLKATTT